jgi:hypothetical protein
LLDPQAQQRSLTWSTLYFDQTKRLEFSDVAAQMAVRDPHRCKIVLDKLNPASSATGSLQLLMKRQHHEQSHHSIRVDGTQGLGQPAPLDHDKSAGAFRCARLLSLCNHLAAFHSGRPSTGLSFVTSLILKDS